MDKMLVYYYIHGMLGVKTPGGNMHGVEKE